MYKRQGEAGVDEAPREANAPPNEGQDLSPEYMFISIFIHFVCYWHPGVSLLYLSIILHLAAKHSGFI